jgi:hypothetical protein
MTFKEAYKILKRLPERNFLHGCLDWGDLWELEFLPYFLPKGKTHFGGADVISKMTGERLSISSAYLDVNRDNTPIRIPVPRFAQEGWDYYDEKTDTFKLKSDAPYWAKMEFEAFYGTDELEQEELPQPAHLAYA